jgi:TRAP-type C4-dicarboxylate transport system substrate-binding protein
MALRHLACAFAAAALVLRAAPADAGVTLKIATLAPQDSVWGREFKRLAADVASDTNGDVTLDFSWNGQAGDEKLMIEKIRSGQLDAAAVTALGLAQTGVMNVLAFELPGLFQTWSQLDRAREAVKGDLEAAFEAKGFTVAGWGDVGAAKTMSIGFEVHVPGDLRGKGVFSIPGDPIAPALFAALGGVNPRPLAVPEILTHLGADVNVITAPPLVAEQLQWASRITHINTATAGFAIGAFLISTSRLRSLTDAQRGPMLARGRESNERLAKAIRNLDAQAFARMKASKVAYEPTDAEKQQWKPVFEGVAKQLCGPVFEQAFCKRLWDSAHGGS